MTTQEFKKIKPEYLEVEGDELWDAMTEYLLRQQEGNQILKSILPIWKTHTLRWLFYRRKSSHTFHTHLTSGKRCSKCKNGVGMRMCFPKKQDDGTYKAIQYCPHCGEEYIEEPTTNFRYRIYMISKWISELFWYLLDKMHLIRSSHDSRYGMFGDESKYVKAWRYDKDWNTEKPLLKKRKWWEYILIERP